MTYDWLAPGAKTIAPVRGPFTGTMRAMSSPPAGAMAPLPPDPSRPVSLQNPARLPPPPPDPASPVSVKTRERLVAARKRFHANDNIAQFIEPGELAQLLDEVEVKIEGMLDSLVIDTEDDHNTRHTARRMAKMYLNEVFKGRYVPAPPITEFPNVERLNELMIVGP